jgi:ABC-type lipoprotein release transport system permease subunit
MVLGALALFATALIAALVPAVRAGRLSPADTLAGR